MRAYPLSGLVALLLLGGCGGDGGSSPAPIPAPAPAPTPAPVPTPVPTPTPSIYDTAEYRQSNGAVQANALAAYDAGASGAGVIVATIDSGIDQASAEFTGRISPLSRDVVSGRSIHDPDGHGTAVAAVLAAARNDQSIEGVAPQATLLVFRGEKEGSCPKCSFADGSIATAIDGAVAGQARVINISLGGGAAGPALVAAVARATAAGVLIVIAAGNENAAQPDAFALAGLDPAVGNGAYIIAGATDANRALASYSDGSATNRAGSAQQIYIAALGKGVLSPGINGEEFYWDGTSLSAPAVSGAAALLAGAFPNLTGRQIADLLLTSADDAGAPGTDDQFGRGILNIAKAFAPKGTTSLAGSRVPVSTTANATLGGALGDGTRLGAALSGAVLLDGYGRAYRTDLGRTLARAARPGLAGALLSASTSVTVGSATHRLSLTIDPGAKARPWLGFGQRGLDALGDGGTPRTALVRSTLWRGASLGLAVGQRLDTLARGDDDTPAFFAAPDGSLSPATALRSASAVQADQRVGAWRFAIGAGTSRDANPLFTLAGTSAGEWRVAADRSIGSARVAVAFGERTEAGGLLGTTLAPAFGLRTARTRTLDAEARLPLGDGWRIAAAARHGWTDAEFGPGLVTDARGLRSFGWRVDLARDALFAPSDRFALRIAQPMRLVDGTLRLRVPDAYDYATLTTHYADRTAALAPGGTERDVEAVYGMGFAWGRVETHLFYRADPEHVAGAAADRGGALTLSAAF